MEKGLILRLRESGFGAGLGKATLRLRCWVHLPENGSLGDSGLGHAILEISTRISVGMVLKVGFLSLLISLVLATFVHTIV